MPRVVGTQIHRSNTPAESMLDYYKTTITIPLLDHLMCELDYRFDSSKTEVIFNGFITVAAKTNSNNSTTRDRSLERRNFIIFQILLGMISQMCCY